MKMLGGASMRATSTSVCASQDTQAPTAKTRWMSASQTHVVMELHARTTRAHMSVVVSQVFRG